MFCFRYRICTATIIMYTYRNPLSPKCIMLCVLHEREQTGKSGIPSSLPQQRLYALGCLLRGPKGDVVYQSDSHQGYTHRHSVSITTMFQKTTKKQSLLNPQAHTFPPAALNYKTLARLCVVPELKVEKRF
jgi:hypothetical protein